MKKLICLLAVAALTSSVFGQGTVAFQNTSSTVVKKWTSTSDSTLISVPKTTGFVQLLAAPAGTAVKSLFTPAPSTTPSGKLFANYSSLAGFLADNPGWSSSVAWSLNANAAITPFSSSGRFNGGAATISSSVISAGANIQYLIIGWTGTYSTFDLALEAAFANPANSFLGQTLVGQAASLFNPTGNPLKTPIPDSAAVLDSSLVAFTLAPVFVPEPGVFALAGLGLAALVAFRRRN